MSDPISNSTTNPNAIPDGWVETTLGEVCILNYGKGLKTETRIYGNIPVYGSSGITGWHNEPLINEIGLIIGRKGSVGTIYKSEVPFFPIDTAFYITKKNTKCDLEYLFRLLQSLGLDKKNSDSAIPGLNRENAYSTAFLLPPLTEQKAIAAMLSAFDDKIELLREQNKTLEELGQTIFNEWFGKYKVGDELPEGWRVGTLGEVCSLKSGFAFGGNDFIEKSNTTVLKIKDLKGRGFVDLSDVSFVKDELKNSQRVRYFKLEVGDIVLAMSGNTTGKIGIIPNLDAELFLNQRVGKLFIDDQKYKTLVYFFLMTGNYEEKILAMGYGSAQPNINPAQIENIGLVYPDKETLENFTTATFPIFTKILDNLHQIQSLTKTRDELLPRLMRGEVRVEV
jgi:type I restriction enzyme, S subunit